MLYVYQSFYHTIWWRGRNQQDEVKHLQKYFEWSVHSILAPITDSLSGYCLVSNRCRWSRMSGLLQKYYRVRGQGWICSSLRDHSSFPPKYFVNFCHILAWCRIPVDRNQTCHLDLSFLSNYCLPIFLEPVLKTFSCFSSNKVDHDHNLLGKNKRFWVKSYHHFGQDSPKFCREQLFHCRASLHPYLT